MNIKRLLESTVDRYPDRKALIFEDRQWTYTDLYARIKRFAQALSNIGVCPTDRVAFYVSTSEESVTTYFACQIIGAVAVPLNYRLSAGEAAYILKDSGARVLVYGDNLVENALKINERVRSCHDMISCVRDKDAVKKGHHHFETLAEQTEIENGEWPVPAEDAISALVYTSGTTGRPKGVIHTHANDHAIAQNCVMEYSLSPNDKALHIAPLYHVGGMQAYFIPHMMVGGTNIVMGKYEAGKTLQEIEKHGVTTLFAVPTQIQEMLFHPEFKNFDVSTLKMITTGGAAISSTTMERVIKELCPRIFNGYGMTEASLTLLLRPEDTLAKLGSCGKPTLITDCRIIVNDPDRDVPPTETVGVNETGQLIVRGPQAMPGYWNKPGETVKKLKGDWIYTGDLFTRDNDGFYYFCGRADDMIISGGENIYPREVEDVLYSCEGVREAAVIGVPDEKWGHIVCAYIVSADPNLKAEDIDAFCKGNDNIAPYKRPKVYRFINELPTNPSGKVLKRELIAAYAAE
jgi:acyl-CoA synthetase (AMP-forming)/AMP-acid ligase II